MKKKDYSNELYAVVSKHEDVIRLVVSGFYPPGCYLFNEMVCDLTTFLWLLYRDMPADAVVFREQKWVYSVLHRHALNRIRDDARYQQRFVYGVDLTGMPGDEGVDPLVKRLYYLVSHIDDDDDRELIMMYLACEPVKNIALYRGRSETYIYRRIKKICYKLRQLDQELDDGDDDMIG